MSDAQSSSTMGSGSEPTTPWSLRHMAGRCPRCTGLLNQQWDTFLRQWEPHCITCGNLPSVKIRRADGRALGEPKYCEMCDLRPVARVVTSAYTRGLGDVELAYCAGCRERVNRQARMSARWHAGKAGRKAG